MCTGSVTIGGGDGRETVARRGRPGTCGPLLIALVMFAGALQATACGAGEPAESKSIVIGALFADDIDVESALSLKAAQLAVKELNQAQVLPLPVVLENRSPVRGDGADPEKAQEIFKYFHDEAGAVALVARGAAPSLIELSNQAAYADLMHCNCSSQNLELNKPELGGDATDAFYRTVTSLEFLADFFIQVALEEPWDKYALYYLDNSFGQSVRQLILVVMQHIAPAGKTLVHEVSHPAGDFEIANPVNQQAMDEIIRKSISGEINLLLLMSEYVQTREIIKYLVGNGYEGAIWITEAAKGDDLFGNVPGLKAWFEADEKNTIMGASGDLFTGANSESFKDAYRLHAGREPGINDPACYDCVYAIALAMLDAQDKPITSTLVKTNMARFKESSATGAEVSIGIGAAELTRAAGVLQSGGAIEFDGASGPVLFNEVGDRTAQGMQTFEENDTGDGWAVKARYDAEFNKLP